MAGVLLHPRCSGTPLCNSLSLLPQAIRRVDLCRDQKLGEPSRHSGAGEDSELPAIDSKDTAVVSHRPFFLLDDEDVEGANSENLVSISRFEAEHDPQGISSQSEELQSPYLRRS